MDQIANIQMRLTKLDVVQLSIYTDCVSYRFVPVWYHWVSRSDVQIHKSIPIKQIIKCYGDVYQVKHQLWVAVYYFKWVTDGLNATEKQINSSSLTFMFSIFSIKVNKIDCFITKIDKIDNHKKSTDRFPLIFDINQ